MHTAKVITICNQKGGVGKTTTTISIASYVAMSSHKTLIIDVDPQANATSGLGINKSSIEISTYDCLLNQTELKQVIISTDVTNLYLAPSNISLTGAEIELVKEANRENRLSQAVEAVRNEYDFIFIDTPPSLGILTLNALTAADQLIVPLQCEYYSLEGVSQLISTIDLVKESLNPRLEIGGIILTMADFRTKLTNEVINEIRTYFGSKVYDAVVPRSIKIAESPGYGKPIFLYDASSIGALKYEEVAKEFLRRNNKQQALTDNQIGENPTGDLVSLLQESAEENRTGEIGKEIEAESKDAAPN